MTTLLYRKCGRHNGIFHNAVEYACEVRPEVAKMAMSRDPGKFCLESDVASWFETDYATTHYDDKMLDGISLAVGGTD